MQEIEKESRMQEVKERSHITEKIWIAITEDTISQDDFMQILEHTSECTWCAERLAEALMQEDAASEPPSYLPEQILERTKQLDVQATVTIRQTSKKLQLFLYSLKVGAAVAFSLLILGVTANFQDVSFTQLEMPAAEQEEKETVLKKVSQAADSATEKMNEFADQILNGGKKK